MYFNLLLLFLETSLIFKTRLYTLRMLETYVLKFYLFQMANSSTWSSLIKEKRS